MGALALTSGPVTAALFAGLGALNVLVYRRSFRRHDSLRYHDRERQPTSAPTRFFKHVQRVWWAAALVLLVRHDFFVRPAGPPPAALLAGLALGLAGLALLRASLAALGREFSPCHDARVPRRRVRGGPYAWLSHPVYAANLLMALGVAVAHSAAWSWASLAVLAGFYTFAARDEGRMLDARFGPRALYTRRLTTFEEIEQFTTRYAASCVGKPLEMRYPPDPHAFAKLDRVMGVFEGPELVGGYVLNRYPTRCFSGLDEARQRAIIDALGGPDNVCELVAVWRDPRADSLVFTLQAWPTILLDGVRMGRKYVFGCALTGHRMRERYQLLRPRVVHQGAHEYELTVFCFTRPHLFAAMCAELVVFPFRRLFRPRKKRARGADA